MRLPIWEWPLFKLVNFWNNSFLLLHLPYFIFIYLVLFHEILKMNLCLLFLHKIMNVIAYYFSPWSVARRDAFATSIYFLRKVWFRIILMAAYIRCLIIILGLNHSVWNIWWKNANCFDFPFLNIQACEWPRCRGTLVWGIPALVQRFPATRNQSWSRLFHDCIYLNWQLIGRLDLIDETSIFCFGFILIFFIIHREITFTASLHAQNLFSLCLKVSKESWIS